MLDADPRGIGPVLDTGADGVILPRVEDPSQLESFARAIYFPPRGTRGFAPRRFSLTGNATNFDRRPACIVQVESAKAVSIAPALAAADVCDALVVGTSDLSFDLGEPLDSGNPRLGRAVAAVREAALEAGRGWGVASGGSPSRMRELAGSVGGTLIYGSDVRLFTEALDTLVTALRATDVRGR
jgi:2-dehydro-3-deoxyglucarate aldolase/4-hydroxy-2-oxoheptanedioate aldolase